MKTRKNLIGPTILAILTMSLALPLIAQPASAQTLTKPEILTYREKWQWIKTDKINIIFPSGGKKPMFLWWYANDTSNIYVVKYKGLIEFMTFDYPYYRRVYEATEQKMQTMLNERYFGPKQHILQAAIRNRIQQQLQQLAFLYGLHRPYLPFSACQWNLTGPTEVTQGDVQYLSFNFTLVKVPFTNLEFAENNVIIRCRFYYTPATENVDDLYTYTVGGGELKMDLIVKNWTWNIDLIQPLLAELAENGIDVPIRKAGLALWINLASIPIEKINLAEQDVETTDGNIEASSMTQSMYVEGTQVGIIQNKTLTEHEQPMTARARLRERFRLRFERGNATFAGFFKFVPKAILRDGENMTVVDVKASYIPAGHHMRLFLCYPYFGNKTLEHDPSLGLETLPTLITPELLLLLVGTASIITLVILAVRWKRKALNIVGTL
ncbi:MAG: hypothetical protein OEY24_03045 [Candidatus Bathyarchaeota archaeon]|nr:hypothetical protein [Candidatus Bathyarchaeota archaeon]MDH5494664.1 hypothetical protein [Candidatus Bathyarchaeota archaeon]